MGFDPRNSGASGLPKTPAEIESFCSLKFKSESVFVKTQAGGEKTLFSGKER